MVIILDVPQCATCSHYKSNKECSAFVVIPQQIWTNEHDHTKPFKGDNGIRFEAIDDTDKS